MSSINGDNKEKRILLDFASKMSYCGSAFRNIKLEGDTYYVDISDGHKGQLQAYDFDSIAALKSELTRLWQDEENMRDFIPVVLASTFKNRPETGGDGEKAAGGNSAGEKAAANRSATGRHATEEDEDILPTYIYTM